MVMSVRVGLTSTWTRRVAPLPLSVSPMIQRTVSPAAMGPAPVKLPPGSSAIRGGRLTIEDLIGGSQVTISSTFSKTTDSPSNHNFKPGPNDDTSPAGAPSLCQAQNLPAFPSCAFFWAHPRVMTILK
jgi:hypothetical protein